LSEGRRCVAHRGRWGKGNLFIHIEAEERIHAEVTAGIHNTEVEAGVRTMKTRCMHDGISLVCICCTHPPHTHRRGGGG